MLSGERWPRLKELFFFALELPVTERARFAGDLAGADRDLTAPLAALLAAHRGDSGPFTRLADAVGAAAAGDAGAEPFVAAAGTRIGSYAVVRLLGAGGMGAVYLARRADAEFEHQVAIKLLRSSLPGEERLARFRLERQTLAQLDHPHIAKLLDGGTTAEGWPFLVMEHVEGLAIDEYCSARGLDLAARLELVRAVCAAVEHAHRNLVVHRDIKPSNILVTGAGVVKLLDFGIAKLLGESPAARAGLTRTLDRVLTPEYASPEQVRGGVITTASDIYSLGVFLYRLLTGIHPYSITTGSATDIERLICEVQPPRPSAAVEARGEAGDPRLARALAGDLDQIVLTAMRKEPERRYQSVAALAEDLRRHLAGLPVLARGESMAYRARKFLHRHRLGAAATALVAAALIAGSAVALWQAGRATRERDRARGEARKAEHMNELLRSVLIAPDPVRGGDRNLRVAELLGLASRRLTVDLAGEPEMEANLRATLGETYYNLGLLDEAQAEHRRALELLRGARGEEDPAVGGAWLRLGIAQNEGGKWAEGQASLERALAVLDGKAEARAERGRALDALGVARQNQGESAAAVAAGRQAVAQLRGTPGEARALASALNNLGIALGNSGELGEAEALHREAIGLAIQVRGEHHPDVAEALANLAGVLDMQGKYGEAEEFYRRALAVQEELLGERHFDFVRTLTSYANLLWLADRSAEAAPLAQRARRLAESTLGAEHPLTAYADNILGGVLLELGQPAEAERHIRAALAVRRKSMPPGHWLIASARSNLGAALLAQGHFDEAERELGAAYEALLADRGREHEKTQLTAERLTQLHAARAGGSKRPSP